MQNLENLDFFEILITQKLLKCLKDPFVRSALNYICIVNFSVINRDGILLSSTGPYGKDLGLHFKTKTYNVIYVFVIISRQLSFKDLPLRFFLLSIKSHHSFNVA